MSTAISFVLLPVNAVFALVWSVILLRVVRSARRAPRVEEGLRGEPPGPAPSVAIVIPAHDEQRVIDRCAASLRAQDHPDLRIVFVLDRCTDRTAEILRAHVEADPRIEVIENGHCPPEWAGKCHAAWLGARSLLSGARPPDYLLFTDADTRFAPELVRASVVSAQRRRTDLLSLLPRLTIAHRFERLLQPVASMALLHMYPIERVDDPDHPRPFANGQFMLFRSDSYVATGGHEAVASDLLEDLAFARRIGEGGGRVAVLVADELLEVSMYERFGAFFRGWTRIFIEACRRKAWRMRKQALRFSLLGVGGPAFQASGAIAAFAGFGEGRRLLPAALLALVVLALTAQGVALASAYPLLGVPRRWALGYPLGCVVVAAMLLRGAADLLRRRPVRWGGREYVLTPR
ncbi:MAG TPA: glycosyltransferase family 2 protein [Phycisphaerales bacterium]|nr:glycosyltransferase family 2 protein [Phycisphaerales bacterium]HMP37917.1 glycosyltransferase family 2 protein [Phycisphaerales bacterium]